MPERLRLLAIGPHASFSTYDVHRGLMAGLQAEGHEVIGYPLERAFALNLEFNRLLKRKGYVQEVDPASVQYGAGVWALDRALHYDVDWVMVTSAMGFHPDFLVKLKRAGRKLAIVFTESPYEEAQEWVRASLADVVFTNERTTAGRWAQVHRGAYYLPHAYDPARHHVEPAADEPAVPHHDVVFVGTGWPERIALFEAVDWTGIDLGLYGTWGKLPSRSRLRRHLVANHPIPNRQTAALYRAAKIGINLHRAHPTAESLNPRAYELAAAACFHLSDARAELAERFGDRVPTFRDAVELEWLVREYLADEEGRQQAAAELPGCIAGETFRARAQVVARALVGGPGPRSGNDPTAPVWEREAVPV